ncbi:MAG: hypothetical protein SCK70_15105, partial [bacterium]|nr:hypothetical protein [bacterium]
EFINFGVRWYSDTAGKWNFYTGLGLTLITVEEQAGLSLFVNSSSDQKKGRGFFLELGTNFQFLPHLAWLVELEMTSAGEGGMPGFVGHSIGGYTFQTGLEFYF